MGGRSGGESDASTGSRIVVENPYEVRFILFDICWGEQWIEGG